MTQFSVSVIVAAYNEEGNIASCLESIQRTGYPGLEVVVVDDNSSDRTAEIASRYNVKVVRNASRIGAPAARNEGLRMATGEIVAFVDGDCTVDQDWLRYLTSDYTEEEIAGVGGLVCTRDTGIIAQYRSFKTAYVDQTHTCPGVIASSDLPAGNSSYRTNVLSAIGGFDPAFGKPKGHEEFELGHRLMAERYRLVLDTRAVVWHGEEGSLARWITGWYGMGYSAISFLVRYRMRDLRVIQLKQIAFVTFLVLCVLTFAGTIPMLVVGAVTGVALIAESARAAYYVWRAARHYGNPKYLLMFPVEIILRFALYIGFIVGLLATIRKAAIRLTRR